MTPWSRSSSVPSDRIPPRNTPQSIRSKGKTVSQPNDKPKSQEVLRLEGIVTGLEDLDGIKDPTGGCFCQARVHLLSKYTPICLQCGLVLCTLHSPHCLCPHCASPLLSPSSRSNLIKKISTEISEVIAREIEQRDREKRERQKAVGDFPSLGTSAGNLQAPGPTRPRKVLSLNAETRKVTVASYAPAPPPVRGNLRADTKVAEERRVPAPPMEIDYVKGKATEGRRSQNLRNGGIVYVPPSNQNRTEGSRPGHRRKKKGADVHKLK